MTIQGKLYQVKETDKLTPRQGEVLLLTAEGKTRVEVAIILGISERTVKAHIDDAKDRLDVFNTPALIARAWSHGILHSAVILLVTFTITAASITTQQDLLRPTRARTTASRIQRTGRNNPTPLPLAA